MFNKARDDSDSLTLMRRRDAVSHSFSTPPTVQLPAATFERRGTEGSKISFRQQNSF